MFQIEVGEQENLIILSRKKYDGRYLIGVSSRKGIGQK